MLAAALAALALAGCGDESPAEPAADQPTAHLLLEQRRAPGSPLPSEGAFGFYEVRGDAPQPVASGSLPTTDRGILFEGSVPAGEYTLVSYQRPCEPSCESLLEPTDRCEEEIALEPGERLTAVVTVEHGSGCTIRTRPGR